MSKTKDFLKSYKKSNNDKIDCGTGLSGEICRHNRKKLNKSKKDFIKDFKKSTYDFRDIKVSVNANQHAQAEKTASPDLVSYLQHSIDSALDRIPLAKGMLTVYKKAEGLYSGFFQDHDGQVVEKFDDMTIPIMAKNLEIKNIYEMPVHSQDVQDYKEDVEIAEDVAARMLQHHNEMYHKWQDPGEPINGGKGSLRIKMGDIDIEIKKSINSFVREFKKSKPNPEIKVIKAIQSWRRNSVAGSNCRNNLEAAQELLREWDRYSEEFYQIMHAMRQNG